jgi:hypothetical protein
MSNIQELQLLLGSESGGSVMSCPGQLARAQPTPAAGPPLYQGKLKLQFCVALETAHHHHRTV